MDQNLMILRESKDPDETGRTETKVYYCHPYSFYERGLMKTRIFSLEDLFPKE